MAQFRDAYGTQEIDRDRALLKLTSSTHTIGKNELDFGGSAIHLVKSSAFHLEGSARGFTWGANGEHHALIEVRSGASEAQAADVAQRLSGELVRGFFEIPKSGLQRFDGPFITLLAPSEAAPPPPPPAPPAATFLSMIREKQAFEKRLAPVLADRAARKERLDRATVALREARSAFVKNESAANAQAIEDAERETRLATLMDSAKPEAAPLERAIAAADTEMNRLLSSQLSLPNLTPFGDHGTFDQLARSYYGGAPCHWSSRRQQDTGHVALAFDTGPCTRIELLARIKYRAIAHSLPGGGGWRVTLPFSRPVTDAEAASLAAVVGASEFFSNGITPDRGTRIQEIDDFEPFDVDAVLFAHARPAKQEPATQQPSGAAQ